MKMRCEIYNERGGQVKKFDRYDENGMTAKTPGESMN